VAHGLYGGARAPMHNHRRKQIGRERGSVRGRENREIQRLFASLGLARFIQSENPQILRRNSTLILGVQYGYRNGKKAQRRGVDALQKNDGRKGRVLDQDEAVLVIKARYSARERKLGLGIVRKLSEITRLN